VRAHHHHSVLPRQQHLPGLAALQLAHVLCGGVLGGARAAGSGGASGWAGGASLGVGPCHWGWGRS
jgi:hypothetical protein